MRGLYPQHLTPKPAVGLTDKAVTDAPVCPVGLEGDDCDTQATASPAPGPSLRFAHLQPMANLVALDVRLATKISGPPTRPTQQEIIAPGEPVPGMARFPASALRQKVPRPGVRAPAPGMQFGPTMLPVDSIQPVGGQQEPEDDRNLTPLDDAQLAHATEPAAAQGPVLAFDTTPVHLAPQPATTHAQQIVAQTDLPPHAADMGSSELATSPAQAPLSAQLLFGQGPSVSSQATAAAAPPAGISQTYPIAVTPGLAAPAPGFRHMPHSRISDDDVAAAPGLDATSPSAAGPAAGPIAQAAAPSLVELGQPLPAGPLLGPAAPTPGFRHIPHDRIADDMTAAPEPGFNSASPSEGAFAAAPGAQGAGAAAAPDAQAAAPAAAPDAQAAAPAAAPGAQAAAPAAAPGAQAAAPAAAPGAQAAAPGAAPLPGLDPASPPESASHATLSAKAAAPQVGTNQSLLAGTLPGPAAPAPTFYHIPHSRISDDAAAAPERGKDPASPSQGNPATALNGNAAVPSQVVSTAGPSPGLAAPAPIFRHIPHDRVSDDTAAAPGPVLSTPLNTSNAARPATAPAQHDNLPNAEARPASGPSTPAFLTEQPLTNEYTIEEPERTALRHIPHARISDVHGRGNVPINSMPPRAGAASPQPQGGPPRSRGATPAPGPAQWQPASGQVSLAPDVSLTWVAASQDLTPGDRDFSADAQKMAGDVHMSVPLPPATLESAGNAAAAPGPDGSNSTRVFAVAFDVPQSAHSVSFTVDFHNDTSP